MANYKPYPKYKNSNIPWLGEIPEHWEVMRAKVIGEFSGSTVDKKINEGETLIRLVNFTDVFNNRSLEIHNKTFMKVSAKPSQIASFNLKIGDVLFTPSSEDRFDIGRSNVVKYSEKDLLYSYHLIRLRFVKDIDINYKKHLFNNKFIFQYFSSECTGTTRQILVRDKFKNIPIILPPFEEQTAIARFLDYKLAKINRFIQKKKQLIKLLNEQKAAIINQAVTKGLDPNARMKDSGIEWLGVIPEHWEVKPIKYFVTCNDESLTDKTDKDYQLRYIDIGNVDSDGNVSEIVSYKFKDAPSRARRIVKPGDIIVSTVRTYLKAIMHIKGDTENLIVSTGFAVLRPRKNVFSEFLNYAIRANYFIGKVVSESNGVSYPAINSTELITLKIAIPLIDEQKKIVQFIDSETEIINTTISKIEKELALTEEYKTALIAEAVTGKIDVRGYEIPEISEEETYDDPDSYREEEEISMAAEDAEEYQRLEE